MRRVEVRHQFVEYLPEVLDEATLYISIPFATAGHRCCCGCGQEVVTPLSPTDWALTFDGETVSLDPSIGNWSFECQSHYWIERNQVKWARRWSPREIAEGRARDLRAKARQFDEGNTTRAAPPSVTFGATVDHELPAAPPTPTRGFWARLTKGWR